MGTCISCRNAHSSRRNHNGHRNQRRISGLTSSTCQNSVGQLRDENHCEQNSKPAESSLLSSEEQDGKGAILLVLGKGAKQSSQKQIIKTESKQVQRAWSASHKSHISGEGSSQQEAHKCSHGNERCKQLKPENKGNQKSSSDIIKELLIKKELSNQCKAQRRKILLYKQKLAFYEGPSSLSALHTKSLKISKTPPTPHIPRHSDKPKSFEPRSTNYEINDQKGEEELPQEESRKEVKVAWDMSSIVSSKGEIIDTSRAIAELEKGEGRYLSISISTISENQF